MEDGRSPGTVKLSVRRVTGSGEHRSSKRETKQAPVPPGLFHKLTFGNLNNSKCSLKHCLKVCHFPVGALPDGSVLSNFILYFRFC